MTTPSPDHWHEVKALFLQAIALPPAQRRDFAEKACAGNPQLLLTLLDMLDADDRDHPALDAPDGPVDALLADAPSPAAVDPAPGARIGAFVLIRLLGEGSSGLVYLAEQERPRRYVAIKFLRPGQSPAALRRLEREAEIMARLRHPGIAQVLEAVSGPSGAYVVMEYIEGERITDFAARRNLSIADRLALFLRVCHAVQHAHAMGVIHRDLKPANILVPPDAQPRILDFGVARAATPDLQHTTTASIPQLVGTLGYMSPEQAGGAAASPTAPGPDTRADVYSLGVILYELLAGRLPIPVHHAPVHHAIRLIETAAPPRLGSISRALRGDIETISAKALEKNPDRRYAAVSELAGDIQRHLHHLPIHARPPSALYEIARFTRRHRSLVASVAVALAAIVAALGWSIAAQRREHADFLTARRVAGSVGELLGTLGPLSGSHERRRAFLNTNRPHLEEFAARHPRDPDGQANLAALEFATGEVEREVGRLDTAFTRYAVAYDILTRVVAIDPSREAWRLRRSVAAVKIGDILRGFENHAAAVDWYQTALSLDQEAAASFPDSYTAHDQLFWSYERLANMFVSTGRMPEAIDLCNKMEQTVSFMIERWPLTPELRWCHLCALHMRAHVQSTIGDDTATIPIRFAAVEEGRRLVQLAGEQRMYVIRHVFSLCDVAQRLIDDDRLALAQQLLDEAEPLVSAALRHDGHERSSHDAALALSTRQFRLHLARNDVTRAIEAGRLAVAHARRAAICDPSSHEARASLVRLEHSLLDLLADDADSPAIQALACDLRDHALDAAACKPSCPDSWRHVAAIALSPIPESGPDLPLARDAAERSLSLQPDHPLALALLGEALYRLGDPHRGLAHIDHAISLAGPPGSHERLDLEARAAALLADQHPRQAAR